MARAGGARALCKDGPAAIAAYGQNPWAFQTRSPDAAPLSGATAGLGPNSILATVFGTVTLGV